MTPQPTKTGPAHLGGVELSAACGHWWRGSFLRRRFFLLWGGAIAVSAAGMFWAPLAYLGLACFAAVLLAAAYEFVALGRAAKLLRAARKLEAQWGLGDDNPVRVFVRNDGARAVELLLLDELPVELQVRDFAESFTVRAGELRAVRYTTHPTERGAYAFGRLYLFVGTSLGLVYRRYAFGPETAEVAVYPSVLQMRQQALRARELSLREGERQLRRLGRSYEFDQIKPYVAGDDYRQLNWKASARANALMVNTYVEERSQQLLAVLDTGRSMLSPFGGMSLLDYAVNSSLALLNVGLQRGDRVGLVGFDRQVHTVAPPSVRREQLARLLELLYRQQPTDFEADFEALYQRLRREARSRSLVLLYTSIDNAVTLERRLPVLRKLARQHLLVVVQFVNEEVTAELSAPVDTVEGAYLNAVAREYEMAQDRIATVLAREGVNVLRTVPQDLTADAVTRYLEVKRRGLL